MNDQIAFLSEWGNDGLDFSKKEQDGSAISTHFIVTALLLSRQDMPAVETVFKSAASKYFENGRIDSDFIDNDHELRKLILTDILSEPVRIFALVVDKRQLIGEGLRYKGSVYKFLHGLTDRALFGVFPNLEMVGNPDEGNGFMDGFIKYTHQNHIPNLFNESTFGFVNTRSEVILQASSFIAGTLARCYDETVLTEQRQDFVQLIQPALLTMKFWPDVFAPYLVKINARELRYNEELANVSVNLANDFLHRKTGNQTPHVIDQLACLGYLVFHFRHINPTRYISSFEIMEHIRVRRGKAVSLHYFQTKVIAPLRDAGVLIASSSRGYKLPASEGDLYDFINHSNTIVEPMLARIKKFRDQINRATKGKLDVLDREEYAVIRKIIE
ncbi:hypothetical protein [Dyadobacter sp. CY312]|uniref:hypothetical protein n=1 Tax=Dyadobacter sp. CY312 TaxID=2907303 RepID=UPI001F36348C|nr:hypothetical protein [Dyadobacter sp. CY312]MCE7042427.1 hypothetical protein [Dyadobacter sp. CY312]